jgi:hypothetical protein
LVRIQDLNAAGSGLNDHSAVRADPRLFAAQNLDRIATDTVDRKRVPVFGFQQFPNSIIHRQWLILKPAGDKPRTPILLNLNASQISQDL